MIPASEWRWFGNAGHFICGQDCRFHLTTLVGPWLVSTVGQLLFDSNVKIGYEPVGFDRLFETMVFRAGEPCKAEGCGCGLPSLSSANELDFSGYNDAAAATAGHYALCEKWASITIEDQEKVNGDDLD